MPHPDDVFGVTYAETAREEAGEAMNGIKLIYWLISGFWFVVLGGMAYFSVPLKWLITVAFLGLAVTIGFLIRMIFYRLEVGRLYMEKSLDELRSRRWQE